MTSFVPIENVRFSKALTGIEQRPDKVILKFADGETNEASILVGADGIKSVVREHTLNPLYLSQAEPVYAGSYCYRGVIPTVEAEEIFGNLIDVAKIYVGHNRCCVTYLISGSAVSSSTWRPLIPKHAEQSYSRNSISSSALLTKSHGN